MYHKTLPKAMLHERYKATAFPATNETPLSTIYGRWQHPENLLHSIIAESAAFPDYQEVFRATLQSACGQPEGRPSSTPSGKSNPSLSRGRLFHSQYIWNPSERLFYHSCSR